MSRYKAVHIKSDAQAAHIFSYIHGNPLDLKEPKWRNGKIGNWFIAKQFLQSYKWSSLGVYTSTTTHPLIKRIINTEFAVNYFSSRSDHFEVLREWSSRADSSIYLE